jgi:hypothetical protein
MIGGYIHTLIIMAEGTQKTPRQRAFLTSTLYTPLLMNGADTLQIFRNIYFSNLLSTSPSRTPRALAILAQVKMVGIRLWLSIKLIAGRLTPTFSAKVSCDRPCSLRRRANSFTTFSINSSEALSLIETGSRT